MCCPPVKESCALVSEPGVTQGNSMCLAPSTLDTYFSSDQYSLCDSESHRNGDINT